MTDRPSAGPYLPLTTKEGWQRFVGTVVKPPVTPSFTDYLALDSAEQETLIRDRREHIAWNGVLKSPQFVEIMKAARRKLLINEHRAYSRQGLIVSGPATIGKTTAITNFGKLYELESGRKRSVQDSANRMPVVYVTVPPAATPKMMVGEFLKFLGLPINLRSNHAEITNTVADVISTLRTELVIVDEIHNLNVNFRSGADASDTLKHLAERCPATFIYAGIEVETSGLFSGTRGQQIAGRFQTLRMRPFTNGSADGRAEWAAILDAMETTLLLLDQPPGTLAASGDVLYARTGGSIGRLAEIVHTAAIVAMAERSERITPALIDQLSTPDSNPPPTQAIKAKRKKAS